MSDIRTALEAARDAFKSYGEQHMAKDPPQVEKARVNRNLFNLMELALAELDHADGGQDRKFAFRGSQFVNRVSGEPIPHNEPVIIFRARDRHALSVLGHYLACAEDAHHRRAIMDRIEDFTRFRGEHPERVREPGTTHHIQLNDPDERL